MLALFWVLALLVPAQAEIRVRHAQGVLVLPQAPRRVAALEFSFVDTMVAVGMAPVGIADDRQPERIIAPLRAAVEGYASVGSRYSPAWRRLPRSSPI
ncbi:hypothetical protein [Ramlibacter sp. 2FC]|uniref:hypothetical protein n=1 Tax=Ramlibacter sp. 2FC TaxID=2502188 RepID=UPI0010F4BE97|nr:hypothetical protein [Ramlibacter sp. 2FC]